MNKRQRKKEFKKHFGVNPPRGIKLQYAIILYENKDAILLAVERMQAALLNAWDQMKEPFFRLAEEIRKAAFEVAEKNRQQRTQEREAMKIEGDINIRGHDRKKAGRAKVLI